jgi:hypothetical protein
VATKLTITVTTPFSQSHERRSRGNRSHLSLVLDSAPSTQRPIRNPQRHPFTPQAPAPPSSQNFSAAAERQHRRLRAFRELMRVMRPDSADGICAVSAPAHAALLPDFDSNGATTRSKRPVRDDTRNHPLSESQFAVAATARHFVAPRADARS